MEVLERVKTLLGITDNLQDDLLKAIQEQTEAHFLSYADVAEVPEKCQFIIVEVVIKRFNRLGAEGISSQRLEGVTNAYREDDFTAYDSIINRLNKSVKGIKFL